jgi:FMN-dependent NADH-azoreductase
MDPTAPNFDFQEAYLRRILGFMGLNDLTFIHAENQRRGSSAEASLAAAMTRVEQVASEVTLAA